MDNLGGLGPVDAENQDLLRRIVEGSLQSDFAATTDRIEKTREELKTFEREQAAAISEVKKSALNTMPRRESQTRESVITKLGLSEIYKDAIEKNLEKFKNLYNNDNPNTKISLALTLDKRIFAETTGTGFIAQATVAVEMRQFGLGRVLIRKVYNFKHIQQMSDEGEWKLTLYSEILYELIGGCITLAIAMNPDNHGNQEQNTTSQPADSIRSERPDGGYQGGS